MGARPAMYGALAPWFHLLTPPIDYAEEAADLFRLLGDRVDGPLRTVLELGSGGGNLASHLVGRVEMTLTDLEPAMLDISRALNPGVEHVEGDMRSLRLGRSFDAVIAHDAIGYMTTPTDLAAAITTAATHLRPGGCAAFLPDDTRETFRASTDHGGSDDQQGRGVRYLEWDWDPDPSDSRTVTHYAILTRDADGTTRVHHDRHELGLFSRAEWEALITRADLVAERVVDAEGRDVFLGTRPIDGDRRA